MKYQHPALQTRSPVPDVNLNLVQLIGHGGESSIEFNSKGHYWL